MLGLVGVIGATAAPLVGKLADRHGFKLTLGLAILISLVSFLVLWRWGYQLWGLIVGVILLDLGIQTGQISNQARIYSLSPDVHSRLNTIYISSLSRRLVGVLPGNLRLESVARAWSLRDRSVDVGDRRCRFLSRSQAQAPQVDNVTNPQVRNQTKAYIQCP